MVKKIVNWLNYCSDKSLLLKLEQKTEYITKNRKAKAWQWLDEVVAKKKSKKRSKAISKTI